MDQKDRLYAFLENWLIRIVIGVVVFFMIGMMLLSHSPYANNANVVWINDFLNSPLSLMINEYQSTLLTIAAILMGFYFTVFTLLGNIRVNSTFASLTEKNFETVIRFIWKAFIASFLYIVMILVNTTIFYAEISMPIWLNILNLTLLMYMFLSSFRFGVIIYLVFRKDLTNIQEHIASEKKKSLENARLMKRLDKYLAEFEKNKAIQQAEEVSKKLQEKRKSLD